jgi:hypothetical protein
MTHESTRKNSHNNRVMQENTRLFRRSGQILATRSPEDTAKRIDLDLQRTTTVQRDFKDLAKDELQRRSKVTE